MEMYFFFFFKKNCCLIKLPFPILLNVGIFFSELLSALFYLLIFLRGAQFADTVNVIYVMKIL